MIWVIWAVKRVVALLVVLLLWVLNAQWHFMAEGFRNLALLFFGVNFVIVNSLRVFVLKALGVRAVEERGWRRIRAYTLNRCMWELSTGVTLLLIAFALR